jgi:tetratricopeptide (TPR) repeat protein
VSWHGRDYCCWESRWPPRSERRCAHKEARAASEEAAKERQHAREAEKQAREERARVRAARQQVDKERDDARARVEAATRTAEIARAVVAFLGDKLLSSGRVAGWKDGYWVTPSGKEETLREAIDAAAGEVAGRFPDRPLVEAEVREVLGSAYLDQGEASLAVAQYERALALLEAKLGPDQPDTVICRNKLARAYRLAGRPAEAGRLYDQNPDTFSHAQALAIRGSVLLSEKKAAEAEAKLRESLKVGRNVYVRDVATVQDTTDRNFGTALVNGKNSVYLPIVKNAEASTLPVVDGIKKSMQLFRDAVPPHVSVDFEFDESPTVKEAIESVATEGLIGAGLTGLMILVLRTWTASAGTPRRSPPR